MSAYLPGRLLPSSKHKAGVSYRADLDSSSNRHLVNQSRLLPLATPFLTRDLSTMSAKPRQVKENGHVKTAEVDPTISPKSNENIFMFVPNLIGMLLKLEAPAILPNNVLQVMLESSSQLCRYISCPYTHDDAPSSTVFLAYSMRSMVMQRGDGSNRQDLEQSWTW